VFLFLVVSKQQHSAEAEATTFDNITKMMQLHPTLYIMVKEIMQDHSIYRCWWKR